MRRIPASLVVAISLLGCGSPALGEPVELLTGVTPITGIGGCYTNHAGGMLLADATYGTRFVYGTVSEGVPVLWPPGFTGRRAGNEVAVLDTQGNVVATTGRRYEIEGGSYHELPYPFVACGYVRPA
jgi:hypothetical protein